MKLSVWSVLMWTFSIVKYYYGYLMGREAIYTCTSTGITRCNISPLLCRYEICKMHACIYLSAFFFFLEYIKYDIQNMYAFSQYRLSIW
ncbi:hypothetical protein QBC43DRAFT_327815 [Cladorrhinum sp. PSN259]|nr:hypothetical protein QBC43DRAFT_327815 [Cladorrhinum sp. PSN259]